MKTPAKCNLRQRLWLSVPPVALCLLDAALTLTGQSAAYWGGDRSIIREVNPIGRLLLGLHPLAFGLGSLAWALAFVALVTRLSERWAILLALGLAISHSIGACSWLVRHGVLGWLLAVVCLAGASELVSLSWRRAGLRPLTTARSNG
jgi:hypothetical protein